jgi:hypothetical protein
MIPLGSKGKSTVKAKFGARLGNADTGLYKTPQQVQTTKKKAFDCCLGLRFYTLDYTSVF